MPERNAPALLFAGKQACRPGHRCGPIARDYHLFHFILSGRGTFRNPVGQQSLGAGQGFLIRPGQLVQYRAHGSEPWTYAWFALRGEGSAALFDALAIQEDGLYRAHRLPALRRELASLCAGWDRREHAWMLLSRVYRLLAVMWEQRSNGRPAPSEANAHSRVESAIAHLYANPLASVTVSALAERSGFSTGYFTQVFRRHTGRSPADFKENLRLERAVDLMRRGEFSVREVAHRVGFEDALYFSRRFRKRFGASPRAWLLRNHSTHAPGMA